MLVKGDLCQCQIWIGLGKAWSPKTRNVSIIYKNIFTFFTHSINILASQEVNYLLCKHHEAYYTK